jgi:hypothetical protein
VPPPGPGGSGGRPTTQHSMSNAPDARGRLGSQSAEAGHRRQRNAELATYTPCGGRLELRVPRHARAPPGIGILPELVLGALAHEPPAVDPSGDDRGTCVPCRAKRRDPHNVPALETHEKRSAVALSGGDSSCPKSAVRAVPARLLLLCLLLRSSWLTVEGGRYVAAGVLHRRGGRAALAVSVSVGWWRSNSQLSPPCRQTSEFSGGCGGLAPPARRLVLVRSEHVVGRRPGCRNAWRSGTLGVAGEPQWPLR